MPDRNVGQKRGNGAMARGKLYLNRGIGALPNTTTHEHRRATLSVDSVQNIIYSDSKFFWGLEV